VKNAFSPPCKGGVAAASIKSREATAPPQTGAQRERDSAKHKEWSLTGNILASDHPARALSERDHFINGADTPPSQGGEDARPQLIHIPEGEEHWPLIFF
jgi:hypothetical protein